MPCFTIANEHGDMAMSESNRKSGGTRTNTHRNIPALLLILLIAIASIWKFGAIAVTITMVIGLCYIFMVHSNKVVEWLKVAFFLLGVITFVYYTVNHWRYANTLRTRFTNAAVDAVKRGFR